MPRPARFPADDILDAARELIVEAGPSATTMTAVAEHLGAPSGSLYYRFAGRDDLVATLWLRCVRRFLDGYVSALGRASALDAALSAARFVVEWSRAHVDDARVLLLHRSDDLLNDCWPGGLREENLRLQDRLNDAIGRLEAALGATDGAGSERVRFAVVDVPYAAVRRSLQAGLAPSSAIDQLVVETASHVLEPLISSTRKESS